MSSSLQKQIYYSDKYYDDEFEYRHVHLPKEISKLVPKNKLMTESEWRNIGIQQSEGWVHYMTHNPERHVVLFRRPRQDIKSTSMVGRQQGEALRANN